MRLRTSRFTAKVAGAPSGNNFTVGSLPSRFTGAGITQMDVQTSSRTSFEEGITGVSGLADGGTVSLRGLLFKTNGNPVLVEKRHENDSSFSESRRPASLVRFPPPGAAGLTGL